MACSRSLIGVCWSPPMPDVIPLKRNPRCGDVSLEPNRYGHRPSVIQ
jgi:hypothetical protein